MSRAAKLTLTGTSLFAIGTIFFVHHAQQAEKAVCLCASAFKFSKLQADTYHRQCTKGWLETWNSSG
jgi:translation initiation factor 2B subunit (eIF-2B alpha/beta/delta family)